MRAGFAAYVFTLSTASRPLQSAGAGIAGILLTDTSWQRESALNLFQTRVKVLLTLWMQISLLEMGAGPRRVLVSSFHFVLPFAAAAARFLTAMLMVLCPRGVQRGPRSVCARSGAAVGPAVLGQTDGFVVPELLQKCSVHLETAKHSGSNCSPPLWQFCSALQSPSGQLAGSFCIEETSSAQLALRLHPSFDLYFSLHVTER